MPVKMRNGASSAFSSSMRSSCASSHSADSPRATVSRGEWSVSATQLSPDRGPPRPSPVAGCRRRTSPSGCGRRHAVPPAGSSASPERRLRAGRPGTRAAAAGRLLDDLGGRGPIPGRARSVPWPIRCASSPGASSSTTCAARRNARTRYVGAPARSSSNAICRNACAGSTCPVLPQQPGSMRGSPLSRPARELLLPCRCHPCAPRVSCDRLWVMRRAEGHLQPGPLRRRGTVRRPDDRDR